MRYCQWCVLPDTRPGLVLNAQGICSACFNHQHEKKQIPWKKRQAEFAELIRKTKKRRSGYDCLIPVSGGKDSTWQVVKCLEYGLRILAVTWKTPGRTPIGQKNLENLIRLGVDHIDYTINPEIEKKFMLETLTRVGDTALPMHMALYSIPLRLATNMRIPLVIWGESPHMEYGGNKKERNQNALDLSWLKRHGILQGTSAKDWISDTLTAKDLEPYTLPSNADFHRTGVQSIFLGYFFPWDPLESLRIAKANGFRARVEGPKVGFYDYADIDCDFISIHHYFKWFKFGFTRLFDNLALEIRNHRMTREEAIQIIRQKRDQKPEADIQQLCQFLNISPKRFWSIAERFRNHKIWKKKKEKWMIPDFIVPDWRWD